MDTLLKKSSISWAELLWFALLILCGMGIWAFVDQQVASHLQGAEPRQEYFDARQEVPIYTARLEAAKGLLLSQQTAQKDLEMALIEQQTSLSSLRVAYPQLDTLPVPDPSALQLPSKIVGAFISDTLQAATTQLTIDSLCTQVTSAISVSLQLSTTLEDKSLSALVHQTTQAQLSTLNSSLALLEEEWALRQFELARQRASLEAMETLYPQLAGYAITTALPTSALQEYWVLTAQQQETSAALAQYTTIISETEASVSEIGLTLADAQSQSQQAFSEAQRNHTESKRWLTLAISVASNATCLAILYAVSLQIEFVQRYGIRTPLVIGGAAAVLAVLIAYQTFELMGATLLGVLIFAGVFIVLTKSVPAGSPEKS